MGIQPEAIIAQAALETGWGKHMIRSPDGRNSFNLFGIKANPQWHGQRVTTETLEFRDGVMSKERDSFRAYQSLEESFSDYADFLTSNPRYKKALETAHDAPAFTRALSEAGYATDPDYSHKINQIMNSERLSSAITQIKEFGLEPLT
jgi:flagellar protein FlgJ